MRFYWDFDIQLIETKTSKVIGVLYKTKHIFSKDRLESLHFGIIHSYLIYGNFTWRMHKRSNQKNWQINKNKLWHLS